MDAAANHGAATAGLIPPHLGAGLTLLLQAYQYADDSEREVWDFAVEIQGMRQVGLNNSDLRWLVCKGYVEVAREQPFSSRGRSFRHHGELAFTKRSCFVLTAAGVCVALESGSRQAAGELASGVGDGVVWADALRAAPRWDADRHQFCVGDVVVKEFKLPSPNQETVLTAFEEEGWPPCIDDPLPPDVGVDPKQRLHDAIKSLNRHQKRRLIRFMGNGTGDGVRWEFFQPAAKLP